MFLPSEKQLRLTARATMKTTTTMTTTEVEGGSGGGGGKGQGERRMKNITMLRCIKITIKSISYD